MSLELKQHADLVRHREFNALRQLMQRRQPQKRDGHAEEVDATENRFESTQALDQIHSLETQMSHQLRTPTSVAATDFAHTHIMAWQVAPTQTSIDLPTTPTLIEAANYFAHDQVTQAQVCLEQAVSGQGAFHDHIPAWLTLLDLYRASNQPDCFEVCSLDFSIRFGRSAPPWLSFVHQADLAGRERALIQALLSNSDQLSWTAPICLARDDILALSALVQQAHLTAPHRMTLDFSHLVKMDVNVWREWHALLNQLAHLPLHCTIRSAAALESMWVDTSAEAMLAHLAFLRCQNRAEAFEELALLYCEQYEISPPDWTAPLCRFAMEDGAPPSATAATATATPKQAPSMPELFGVHQGEQIERVLNKFVLTKGLVIRCDRLLRCDPEATAALVKWVEASKPLAPQIEFKDVHRLIALYFLDQGLDQQAKVTIRKD
ncbi:MAG: hypothetical protein QM533_12300 [Cytophagales bacterium]|nr:hypothetical protein [Cytophagales bacterium]